MSDAMDLARRAVACRRWRWMPGMRIQNSRSGPRGRIIRTHESSHGVVSVHWFGEPMLRRDGGGECEGIVPLHSDIMPDLTDPATLGCLLALVREVHGPHANTMASEYEPPERRWSVFGGTFGADDYGHEVARGPTEAEALVAALEAAP